MSVVFYFMEGCPACHATWPAWKKVKAMTNARTREVESAQVPPGAKVESFPTFVVEDENGTEVKRAVGRRLDARALLSELGLRRKQMRKTRRGRSLPRSTRRKIR